LHAGSRHFAEVVAGLASRAALQSRRRPRMLRDRRISGQLLAIWIAPNDRELKSRTLEHWKERPDRRPALMPVRLETLGGGSRDCFSGLPSGPRRTWKCCSPFRLIATCSTQVYCARACLFLATASLTSATLSF